METLLRVPGIGPVSARRICSVRRLNPPRWLSDLGGLGVVVQRAAGFMTLRGRKAGSQRWSEQLAFWPASSDEGRDSRTYEFSPGTFR